MLLGREEFDAEVCVWLLYTSKLVRFDRSDEAATWGFRFREAEAVWVCGMWGRVSLVACPHG